MHHIFNITMGGMLQLAPIGDNPQHVLDVGTGTGNAFCREQDNEAITDMWIGIWAIDFAE